MKKKLMVLLCLCISLNAFSRQVKHTFKLGESDFLLDGKPFQIISGEIHYPRVPKEAWRDRMKMAKAMGLNTIGTYVFWNLHEPQKGTFDFSGNNDIAGFVRIAQEEGLWVILRPSPYVCAEWEFGGYPYWLQNEKGLIVRSKEKQYLEEYRKYINEVGKQLAPLQINHGGNILMVQVENEYGSYAADKEYLNINKEMFIEAGFDGLLYTCDPENDLQKGYLEGLLPAINGQDNPEKVKQLIGKYHNGKGPYFIAEWYPAWFDWWGTPHHTVPAEKYTKRLDSVLAAGISINMYMFHGGSTRDFMNGANYKDISPYEPQTSSYDYDAPLNEAGNATEKFRQFRSVIQKNLPKGTQLPAIPADKPTITIKPFRLVEKFAVFNCLPDAVKSENPLTFEDLKQDYGYMLYRTKIKGGKRGMLQIKQLRDYALIFINQKRAGILDRRLNQDSLEIQLPEGEVELDIFVENMGRVNFGKYLLENKKGITERVLFAGVEVKNWQMYSLPFNSIAKVIANKIPGTATGEGPVIQKGSFTISTVGDTYLDMSNWGKGVVWLNGHNLGKYWSIGPQQTLYVPKEWLKKGKNEITVLELIKPQHNSLEAIGTPILNTIK
ncbi:glycoside hydrolase family 35 protein [Pedobacter metabolipauper]|uniref:Beta-galactosidase n=1 Tax=Pedobacter metabolipauper TaxID=425513 RepID=A0A4R6SUI8_9SPHI|nr:glycoside hydrolase family 35 protein [Pedobacter metabolipauper]TDQ08071.1 beta-galactosidase [Pedobacter metabolipauper]